MTNHSTAYTSDKTLVLTNYEKRNMQVAYSEPIPYENARRQEDSPASFAAFQT